MTRQPNCMFSKFFFLDGYDSLLFGSVLMSSLVFIRFYLNSISIKYFYFHKLIERTSKHANSMLYSSTQHEDGLCVAIFENKSKFMFKQ